MPGQPSGGGGGGLGGGGFGGLGQALAVPNIGSLIQAAQPPGWEQFLIGVSQIPGIAMQSAAQMSDMMERREQMKSLQLQNASTRWNNNIAMIQKNPQLAQSPAMIRDMQQLHTLTGFMLPMDSTGAIDKSVWGASFDEFIKQKDFADRWWSATPDGRRAMAAAMNLVGVPESAFTAAPVLTEAESVMKGRLAMNEANTSDMIKNRDLNQQYKDGNLAALSALDLQKIQSLRDNYQVALKNADTRRQDGIMSYNLGMARVNMLGSIAQGRFQNNITVQGMRGDSAANVANIHGAYGYIDRQIQNAQSAINDETKAIAAMAQSGVVDASDPVMQGYLKQLDADTQNLHDLQVKYQTIKDEVGPHPENLIHSRNTSAATGKQSQVNNANQGGGQQFQTGKVYTDAQGRRAMYLGNGQWQAQP